MFDAVLTYETRHGSRVNALVQPARIETRVVKDAVAVRRDSEYFEELWAVADDLPDASPGSQESIAGDPGVAARKR